MPIDDIAAEVIGGPLKAIGRILAEIVIEICIRGLGYWICRPFSRSVDPDGLRVLVVGVAAWALILAVLYSGYEFISTRAAVDQCSDAGGIYDYKVGECSRTGG